MISILFFGIKERWRAYEPHIRAGFARENIAVKLENDMPPEEVDYIIYSPEDGQNIKDFSRFPNLKAVHGTWAGVEQIVHNPTLQVPFARMVEYNMSAAMTAWVMGHVLRYHLHIDHYILAQNSFWHAQPCAYPQDKIWTVLGQGVLGQAVTHKIASFGFNARGWSRHARKDSSQIQYFYGDAGLKKALLGAHGVILLLPQTSETENIINQNNLVHLAKGAFLINAGRGGLIDDSALVDALECGQLAHACLDVFRAEPLARNHPFWRHPKITVTPHVAAETHPKSGSRVIVENIARAVRGEKMHNLIISKRGY